MVTRLEIAIRPDITDPRGEQMCRKVRSFLGIPVRRIRSSDVYHVEAPLERAEAERILAEFVDPVLQRGSLGRLETGEFDVAVRVGYKPGVTDPVGKSARVAIEDLLGRPLGDDAAVYCSQMYFLDGVDAESGRRIAVELLANPVIQTVNLLTFEEWKGAPPDLSVPRVEGRALPTVQHIDLDVDDEALMRISREGLLALSLEEMQAIRDHFRALADDPGRRELGLTGQPTDAELECLAQTWSEHCKHKIFNATIRYEEAGGARQTIRSLFSSYIKRTTKEISAEAERLEGRSWLVSVFHDNAGVVAFDDRRHLVFKVETHNSPSALDPYGGAITGIVGVNRDPFGTGLGSELLTNVWGYCFGPPDYDGKLPGGLMHPRRIRDGVHHGVIDGGNQSGVPYGRGWELFDERFLGKPLVFCGTVGALPVTVAGRPGESKGAVPGDAIVMAGGRIGADGIHGATFSSAALDESAPVQAVQIGDPITQKLMFDFLLEARDRGLYRAITDNGAGGLSSSVGEMAESSGGARLDLSKAPLKYAGLAPWEILVSEAQERMTLAVAPESIDAFIALARRRGVEATVIGEFTDDGMLHVMHGEQTVAAIAMSFLHDGLPEMVLDARWEAPRFTEPPEPPPDDLNGALCAMLGRLNLCSGEEKARHYDHEVKGLTVVHPYVGVEQDVPAEATVFLAAHDSRKGFVLSEAVNPFYSDIDTHAMARAVVDEAMRKQLCGGARLDRIALLDNFCWPDPIASKSAPDGAYKLAQLVRACRGLYEATRAFSAPLISGKDSMKNDAVMQGVKISVPPTLLVSAIGQIDDVTRALTLTPQQAGDRVYLLGETRDESGGSEYLRWLGAREGLRSGLGQAQPYVGNKIPRLDVDRSLRLYRAFADAHALGLIRSAAAPAMGGLGVALAKMAMAGELELWIDLGSADGLAADVALFSESCARFVVTVAEHESEQFERCLAGVPCRSIGSVNEGSRLRISIGGTTAVDLEIATLKRRFKERLSDDA